MRSDTGTPQRIEVTQVDNKVGFWYRPLCKRCGWVGVVVYPSLGSARGACSTHRDKNRRCRT